MAQVKIEIDSYVNLFDNDSTREYCSGLEKSDDESGSEQNSESEEGLPEMEFPSDDEITGSDDSDAPGDGILIAPEISLSAISINTSSSSFVTSSEDDYAISEDRLTPDSLTGMIIIKMVVY